MYNFSQIRNNQLMIHTYYTMNKFKKYYVDPKKLDTQKKILCDFTYIKFRTGKIT